MVLGCPEFVAREWHAGSACTANHQSLTMLIRRTEFQHEPANSKNQFQSEQHRQLYVIILVTEKTTSTKNRYLVKSALQLLPQQKATWLIYFPIWFATTRLWIRVQSQIQRPCKAKPKPNFGCLCQCTVQVGHRTDQSRCNDSLFFLT